ncbi:substrate-binding domain-containing protein [Arthrobacter sp. MMS18-M83]|uniref:substrate-binding domain-containing protein n=1 Tax=Arthrobacter sp. MMS18-M83 TaxID=2996261 RepID=UPI00227C4FE7|nr:substrate-binding domain-containing protein [Arthrobacter sp. MMS18-M83]WAH96537.1 substrate-binding domain-containing protein [Arthrobacter sp. MMS18-M83]
MHDRSIRRVAGGLLLLGISLAACASPPPKDDIRGALTAIGSPIQSDPIDAWTGAWQKSFKATSLNYSPDGSKVGLTALATGQAYFAALDAPLTSQDQAATKTQCGPDGAFSVPTSITSVGVAFNLPSVRSLKLSPGVLAKIFSGEVTRWNDKAIATINPELTLPNTPIVPITASSASALTTASTRYLSSSADWPSGVTDKWTKIPGGAEVKNLRDLVKKVDDTAGAVAFMDSASIGSRFDTALLSFGGPFTRMSKDSVAAAVQGGTSKTLGTGVEFSLPEKTDRGYALGTVNYQAFCTTYKNHQIASLVKSWGNFVLSPDGQFASGYFAGVASPSEQALQDAARLIGKIGSLQ